MKKSGGWSFRKIFILAVCIILFLKLVFDFAGFWSLFSMAGSAFLSLLSYILTGFIIAYVLNSYINFWEKKVLKKWTKKPKAKKYTCIIIGYVTLAAAVVLFIFAVVPALYSSITSLGKEIPSMIQKIMNLYKSVLTGSSAAMQESVSSAIEAMFAKMVTGVVDWIDFGKLTSFFTATTGVIFNTLMGIMISVYMLIEKDNAMRATNKILNAVFPDKTTRRIKWAGRKINEVFQKYFAGKILQAIIMMIIAYIVFAVAGVPYAMLFAVIIAIFNMIPYIGPWVGAIPVIVVSLAEGFWMGVIAVVCVLIIQAIDNWLVSPRVIGTKMGVSPLLVLIGLCIGGSIFGIPGMIIGDVMAALVKVFFYDTYVEIRGRKKMRERNAAKEKAKISADAAQNADDTDEYQKALADCFEHGDTDEIDTLFLADGDISK